MADFFGPPPSKAMKARVWENGYNHTKYAHCPCCDEPISVWDFVLGHRVSLAHQGTDKEDNLFPVCAKCNEAMGSSNYDEFMRSSTRPQQLPDKVLNTTNGEERLIDILTNYDPLEFGASTLKYRIPEYQRHMTKPTDWCAYLIESVLENKHIGSITLSSWSTPNSEGLITWYNIEDGQTRLSTCHSFMNGHFRTKYGRYQDNGIKERFDDYKIGVTKITRSRPGFISDIEFFTELCTNFNLLQETNPLTDSEKFWTQMPIAKENFLGVDLLRFTMEMVNERFKDEFKLYYGLPCGFNHDSMTQKTVIGDKIRKRLATLVTICSGCIDPAMYKQSYIMHRRMMMPDYKIPDQEEVIHRLDLLFRAFKLGSGQPLSFVKSLTGPILHDAHQSDDKHFISLWERVFAECTSTPRTPKEWMQEVVLENSTMPNAKMKLQQIRCHFNSH